jgi:hypothetical protein
MRRFLSKELSLALLSTWLGGDGSNSQSASECHRYFHPSTGVRSPETSANAYVSVDVTSLVTKTSSDINLTLVGLSSTNLSTNSREGVNKPQLVVTTG